MVDLDYFASVPILRLQSAARKAGLSFRNGSLGKADIINRLANYPAMAAACVAALKREDAKALEAFGIK